MREFGGRLRPLFGAVLAIGIAARALAARDPRAPLDLVLSVSVADKSGQPVDKARVMTEGAHGASATTGNDGRCSIRIPLGRPADLSPKPFTVEVRAQAHGERLALAEGSDALRVELTVTGTTANGARVRVRSTSARCKVRIWLRAAIAMFATAALCVVALPSGAGVETRRFTAEQTVEVAGISHGGSTHAADPPAATATKTSASGGAPAGAAGVGAAGATGHAPPPAVPQGSAGSKSAAPVKPTVDGATMQTTRMLPHPISTASGTASPSRPSSAKICAL